MRLIIAAPDLDNGGKKLLDYELNRILPGIKKRISRYSPNDRILRARLTSEGAAGELPIFHLTLSLQLPDHPIVVQKDGTEIRSLVQEAEKALRKELRRSTARIRKEHLARRRTGAKKAFTEFARESQTLPKPEIGTLREKPETLEANPVFARLRPLLGPLYNFARDHINTAQVAGELPTDYLSPDDLVDQALLHVAENSDAFTNPDVLEKELYRYIQSVIDEESARHTPDSSPMISLEQGAPDEERWGITGPEVEEREYHQPFAALRMEDILIDDSAIDPEHQMSDVEQHRLILKFLADFPAKSRTAFYLNRVEGFEPFEIAMIQDRDEKEVESDISSCAKTLLERWEKHSKDSGEPKESEKQQA